MTAKKCTKKRDARAKLLFCQFKPIAFVTFPLPSPSSDLKVPIVKLSTSPKAEHSTSQSCFPVLNWFYECEHRFVNKPMVIAEPTVPSVRLLGLGSRLYPSNLEGPQSSK